jgi:hypothetical protein
MLYMPEVTMMINIDIDHQLIEEARRLGHHQTNEEAATAALNE